MRSTNNKSCYQWLCTIQVTALYQWREVLVKKYLEVYYVSPVLLQQQDSPWAVPAKLSLYTTKQCCTLVKRHALSKLSSLVDPYIVIYNDFGWNHNLQSCTVHYVVNYAIQYHTLVQRQIGDNRNWSQSSFLVAYGTLWCSKGSEKRTYCHSLAKPNSEI